MQYQSTADRMAQALRQIATLDPDKDSPEGLNEWGEADCFQKAKQIAQAAIQLPLVTGRLGGSAEDENAWLREQLATAYKVKAQCPHCYQQFDVTLKRGEFDAS